MDGIYTNTLATIAFVLTIVGVFAATGGLF